MITLSPMPQLPKLSAKCGIANDTTILRSDPVSSRLHCDAHNRREPRLLFPRNGIERTENNCFWFLRQLEVSALESAAEVAKSEFSQRMIQRKAPGCSIT